jgi:hypothetical protein
MKWRYKLQHWLEGSVQCHTLATLSHTQRARGSHCTEGCMSLSTGLGAGAWIPPHGTEPNSVIIQPISITSEHFTGGPDPAIKYICADE